MFHTLLSRVLASTESPTADLYFRNACGDLIGAGVEQLAPTVFASERACLVIRHDLNAGRLPPRRRLIYLLDDDVEAGATDASLPFLYRQKLRVVEGAAARRLRRFAGVAVVSSPALARRFQPLMETHLLRPYWSEPMRGLAHFEGAATGGWIDMAYLGSATHRADFAFLVPVVRALLLRHPRLRLHLSLEHRLPGDLEEEARVVRIPGASWGAYRRALAERRFHIALYPLLDSPFNRARSPNKLIEHAVVGAAPVYSETWREAGRAVVQGAGIAVPNHPEYWIEAVNGLIERPDEMRRTAQAAQRLAAVLNSAEDQRRLWRSLLDIRIPVPA